MGGVLNQVVFNVLKNPNPLKDDEASAVLDAAVLFLSCSGVVLCCNQHLD